MALYSVVNDMPLVEKLRIGKFSVTADTDASTVVARLQYAFPGPRGLNSPDLLFGLRGDSPWLVGGHAGGHLTNLSVTACSEQALLHPDIARCLGAYLPLTRSLKTLNITVPMLQESAKAIIHGLSSNDSIEELILSNSAKLRTRAVRCQLRPWMLDASGRSRLQNGGVASAAYVSRAEDGTHGREGSQSKNTESLAVERALTCYS
ncbi:uncharacterized protein LOC142578429 [Dermacentor variabilis]|uniref:uncharacterized protein LOC142578429 n=1 Tax=Dermacentor variabilis TaxID=34621 RepID=UPI003F5BB24E